MKIQKSLPFPWFAAFLPHEPTRARRRLAASGISETIELAFAAAGLNTKAGPMKGVSDTIQQALSAAGLTQQPAGAREHGVTIDGTAREVASPYAEIDGTRADAASRVEDPLPGTFLKRSFANDAGTRNYMLYVPASYATQPRERVPAIVMLHGCTQSPDDFAAGTRMNALADEHGFLVIYPAQPANANGSRCWNWFRPEDQVRDSGEPSLIAGITREVASEYRIDTRRIFVAGMSAGASMAVILGAMYPELYFAVGAHSGLPYGAAHDVNSAFAAMRGGGAPTPEGASWIPTIVFHGDSDRTVDARNADAIIGQVTVGGPDKQRLRANVRTGTVPGGRKYKRTDYRDQANQTVVEHWTVHGAGHAWSGGSAKGSFTDPTGPDASAEMIRFFLSQRRAGTS